MLSRSLLQPGMDTLCSHTPDLHRDEWSKETRAELTNLQTGFSYKIIKYPTD